MNRQTYAQADTQAAQRADTSQAADILLQRKCASATHAEGGGQHDGYREGRGSKRSAVDPARASGVRRDGQHLSHLPQRLGHDFGRIKVYDEAPLRIQTKLTVGLPGDEYELEADRTAETVMRMPEPLQQPARPRAVSGAKSLGADGNPERLQTKAARADNVGGTKAPSVVHEVLRSSGRPLDAATRDFMEPRFGHDFGRVRVHTDSRAAQSADLLAADAYTAGHDIIFGRGQFSPGTTEGRRLLAHELTHVLQQSGGGAGARYGGSAPYIARQPKPTGDAGVAEEETAEEEQPAEDTMAGSLVTRIIISLARGRVGFQTAVGTILGNVSTDLKPGSYELKAEPDKQRWAILKPETKSGFRFDVTLEGANPWTLAYPETFPMDIQAGFLNEPKTYGDMMGAQGPIDELWLYEGMKPNPVKGPDDFESAHYDLDYRSEGGNLSKWLVVQYRDNTTKEIHLDSITESTPRLWAAKKEAIRVMEEYNLNFILGVFPTVFFIITINPFVAPMPSARSSFTATRRSLPKSGGGAPSRKEPTPNEPAAAPRKQEPTPGEPAAAPKEPAAAPKEPAAPNRQQAGAGKTTSEQNTLTNGSPEIAPAQVLERFEPGSSFSGAYNPEKDTFVALASEGATLKGGAPAPKTVARRGGHADAEAQLVTRTGTTDRSKNIGFTLTLQPDNTLKINWTSGQINGRNFPQVGNRLPPPEARPPVVRAIESATGLKVVE